jgi:hypothetical protein
MSRASQVSIAVYKTKPFARFAKKARIADSDLWHAAQNADLGMIDADLGGGVIKQRIARRGEGKSGGSRSIIVLRRDDRAVYVFGFEKKDMANISSNDLLAFRRYASTYLGFSIGEMNRLVEDGTVHQINAPQENIDG